MTEQTGLQHQIYGPKFEERVENFCSLLRFIGRAEELCQHYEDIYETWDSFDAVPMKLINHYAQNYLAGRFQEYSDCWGMLLCHKQPLIQVDQIEKVPITFIFGEQDDLGKYEIARELMYEIKSEKSVLILKDYNHFSFNGEEPNDQLQKMVLQTFSGEMIKSENRWTSYVE